MPEGTPRPTPAMRIAVSALLVCAGVWVAWTTYGLPSRAGIFPSAAALVLVAASAIDLVRESWRRLQTDRQSSHPVKSADARVPHTVIFFAVLLVAALTIKTVGYIPAAIVCGLTYLAAQHQLRPPGVFAAVVITFAVYGLFVFGLGQQLPVGELLPLSLSSLGGKL